MENIKQLQVGQKVKTRTEFVGVPVGTIGIVVDTYESFEREHKEAGLKSATIEWQGERFEGPMGNLRDGFSPEEFKYLELIETNFNISE